MVVYSLKYPNCDHLLEDINYTLNSSPGETASSVVSVTNVWSRNTLAAPAKNEYFESFFTVAFRKAWGANLGTVSYSKCGLNSTVPTDT